MSYSNQNIDKIKELITTTQNNLQNLSPEEKSKLYKDFADFLKKEGNQTYLKHYPIFQEDFPNSNTSLFERLNNLIDLDHNQLDNYINDLINKNGTDYSKIWNESLKSLLDQLKVLLNDNYKICDVWKQQDAKDANAGKNFIKNLTNPVVVPNENIEKQQYLNVRGNDKEEKALYNRNNLQFTHHQNNDDIANRYIRLLMDKYSRNVEVEDLNRNFWIIGQVISIISGFLFEKDSPINQLFKKISSETVQLWENLIYLWAQAAILCQHKDYPVRTKIIYLPNNNFQTYRKFDDFNFNSIQDTNELKEYLKQVCHPYKNIYTENSLIIVPIIRIGNSFNNYYSNEDYYGYYKYNRNNNEEDFILFNYPLHITTSPFKDKIYHFWNDKINHKIYFQFGKEPIEGAEKKKDFFEQYCIRNKPSVITNGNNFSSLTIKFDDPTRKIVGHSNNNIGSITITGQEQNPIDISIDMPERYNNQIIKDYSDSNNKIDFYLGELLSNGSEINIIIDRDIKPSEKYLRPISPSKYQIEYIGQEQFFLNPKNKHSNLVKEDNNIIENEKQALINSTNTDTIEFITYGHPSFLTPYNQQNIAWSDINKQLQSILLPSSDCSSTYDSTEYPSSYRIWETTGLLSQKHTDTDNPHLNNPQTKLDQLEISVNNEIAALGPNPSIQDIQTIERNILYQNWEKIIPTYQNYLTQDPSSVWYVDNGNILFNPGAYGEILYGREDPEDPTSPEIYYYVQNSGPRYYETHETIYKKILVKIPIKNKNRIYEIPYNCIRNSTLQALYMAGIEFKPELDSDNKLILNNFVRAGHRVREYSNTQLFQNKKNKKQWCIKRTHLVSEFGPAIRGAFINLQTEDSNHSSLLRQKKDWVTLDRKLWTVAENVIPSPDPSDNRPILNFIPSSESTNKILRIPDEYKGFLNNTQSPDGWIQYDKDSSKDNYNTYTSNLMPICYYGWNISSQGPQWTTNDDIECNNTQSYNHNGEGGTDSWLFENIIKYCYDNNDSNNKTPPLLIPKPTLSSIKTGYQVSDRLPSDLLVTSSTPKGSFKMTSAIKNAITQAIQNNQELKWNDNANLSIGTEYSGSGQLRFYGFTNMVLTTYLFFDEDDETNYISGFCWLKRVNTDRTLNIVNFNNENRYYLSWNKNWEMSDSIFQSTDGNILENSETKSSTQLDFEQTLENDYVLKKITGDFVNNAGELVFDFSKYPSNGKTLCDLLEPTGNKGIYTAGNGNIKPQDNSMSTINT